MNTRNQDKNGIVYSNKNIGFSITIPDNWLEVKKSSYHDLGINSNTLFIFSVNKFSSLTAVFSGFAKTRAFNKLFDKMVFKDQIKILTTGEKEINNHQVKYIVTDINEKKVINCFCLINEMIINFNINLEKKNKIFKENKLFEDGNVKKLFELLETLKVFRPVNPPIYINDREKEKPKEVKEEKVDVATPKKIAQKIIELDCKYKHILIPKFYFKYIYKRDNSNIILTIINDEIYFSNDCDNIRFVRIDNELVNRIEKIISNKWNELIKMDVGFNSPKTEASMIIKFNDESTLIDILDRENDIDMLMRMFKSIIREIKDVSDINFDNCILFPGLKINKKDKVELRAERMKKGVVISEEMREKTSKTLNDAKKARSIKKEIDDKRNEFISRKKVTINDDIRKEASKILENVRTNQIKKKEYNLKRSQGIDAKKGLIISDEMKESASNILNKAKEAREKRKNPINEEVFNEATEVLEKIRKNEIAQEKKKTDESEKEYVIKEAENTLNTIDNNSKYYKYQPNQDKREYDLTTFDQYFHNIDGHASFKFMFPKNSGYMNVRDFNVFDIEKDDYLQYRVFIFKCEDAERYEEKSKDWMNKNVQSNETSIKDEYEHKSDNSLNIKTYLLENNKFYKIVYKYGYLISVSSIIDEDKLFYADIALDTVEIGEDDRSYVESINRKNRSIDILRMQGIPYIDELPSIPSSYEVKGKTLEEIVKRAIALCICCNYANDIVSNKKKKYLKDSKKFFNKLLDKFNVRDVMTKEEKSLFDKVNNDIAIQISWQFEGYYILLWVLGLVDEITYPDVLVDADSITSIVSSCDSYKEFYEKCGLRDVQEVLDLADLTYRYDWYCVESKINGEEPIINPEIVMERHRALKWLLSEEKWDEVELNT